MAGEINGTNAVITRGGTVVGQMEMTVAYNGTPIDISSKTDGDFIKLMDAELAGKQVSITGSIVYNDNNIYEAVRADAITGTQVNYIFTYSNGEQFSALMTPTGLSDSAPHGDKVTTSITFLSSDTITYTPAT
tara:strand:- start:106 stop:504 length:399 start_codon:yes stop_codon:yes gene_type:complete